MGKRAGKGWENVFGKWRERNQTSSHILSRGGGGGGGGAKKFK